MFSDLVGSTALSARMDPEDLREVISAYQKCVAETVQRFGGFVAKYMGDGVLITSAIPRARRRCGRAVRAGLEWSRRSTRSKPPFFCKPASELRQGWYWSATWWRASKVLPVTRALYSTLGLVPGGTQLQRWPAILRVPGNADHDAVVAALSEAFAHGLVERDNELFLNDFFNRPNRLGCAPFTTR